MTIIPDYRFAFLNNWEFAKFIKNKFELSTAKENEVKLRPVKVIQK